MRSSNQSHTTNLEVSVRQRYSAAAECVEPALCCPVEYQAEYLDVIPSEVLERDYGCGDPSPYVKSGDTVLDLGCGAGKLCFIAAQIVGPAGRVIGIDSNSNMLALARQYQPIVSERLGFDNVEFRCGRIQDLSLNLEVLAQRLQSLKVRSADDLLMIRTLEQRLRHEEPLVESASVDCVVSNCVLNLVAEEDRTQLLAEIYRVLAWGGCAAISDIVSDEDVPDSLKQDDQLWSGCISGAWREDAFLKAFEAAGFHGVRIAKRQVQPWRTVEGIEFRSVTVVADKGKAGPCLERNQALIYRGPFKQVEDDDGHVFCRGERMAVCDKTFQLLQRRPYDGMFLPVEPHSEVALADAQQFECRRAARRHPRETKGTEYRVTTETADCCGPRGDCC